jgi:hypothetical protein
MSQSVSYGDPLPTPESVISGKQYRLTVLTPGLVRLEYSPDGEFEDRASTFAVNRRLPKPECRFKKVGDGVELVTERMRLYYDGKSFTPSGLHVVLVKKSMFPLVSYHVDQLADGIQRSARWELQNGDTVSQLEGI